MEQEKQEASKFWNHSPAGSSHAPGENPGTKEYFDKVRLIRSTKELHGEYSNTQ